MMECIAIARALGPELEARARETMVNRNPRLRGAHLADLLDMSHNEDAHLHVSEPYFEQHAFKRDQTTATLTYMALVALYEAYGEPPSKEQVEALVDTATKLMVA